MKNPNRSSCLCHAAASIYLIALTHLLLAQSGVGSISGFLHDPTGAVVSGAEVTVTNIGTNVSITVRSNEAGDFTAPNLAVGQYSVKVQRENFKPAVVSNITVNASANVRTDVTLELGTVQQTIEVQANAAQLQTEDAKTSVTVTNKLVDDLPLAVSGALRSPFDLAVVTPQANNFSNRNLSGDYAYGVMLGGGQGGGV